MDSAQKKTVLVVEDEPFYQHTLAEKLGIERFTILTAKNGEEGLAEALKSHPSLILLDVRMPKMGGIEMAQKLREDEWGKGAKVIILTALNDMTKVEQALESDVFQYFVKADTKLESLVEKVKEMTK